MTYDVWLLFTQHCKEKPIKSYELANKYVITYARAQVVRMAVCFVFNTIPRYIMFNESI